MKSSTDQNPYAGNILVDGLGALPSREDLTAQIAFLPPLPGALAGVPWHVRLHLLMQLRDFHLPTLEGVRAAETIDLMLRPSYRYRDPAEAQTWQMVSNSAHSSKTPRAPAMAAAVVGHSGVGKTEAILRALNRYPKQVIFHERFPRLIGPHPQVVWISVDVPASGKSIDLARNLRVAWDAALQRAIPDREARFLDVPASSDGARILDEWRQVAISHFLGVLHLDEVQNFFKIPSLRERAKRTRSNTVIELSIVEDQCLRWILTLLNTWQIPLLVSGTPDGIGALTKRLSNSQRLTTSGFHKISPFEGADDVELRQIFLPQLARYQFVLEPLPVTDELAQVLIEHTAGIRRLIVALWIAAHRVAFERGTDDLRISDFRKAAATYLAPVAPAVAALRSRDPARMSQFDDLIGGDDEFWATFWGSVGSA